MKAIDTNILVRWITRDDEQRSIVAEAIMREPVLISLTVLIELVWVLGARRYAFRRGEIAQVLRELLKVDTVTVERQSSVAWCIERYEVGADFADMVHLVAAHGASSFVTFEHDLAMDAGDASPLMIQTLD